MTSWTREHGWAGEPLDRHYDKYEEDSLGTNHDPILENQPIDGGYQSASGSGGPIADIKGGIIEDDAIKTRYYDKEEETFKLRPVAWIEDDAIKTRYYDKEEETFKLRPVAWIEDDTIKTRYYDKEEETFKLRPAARIEDDTIKGLFE
jgi:hypothetical protein